MDESDITAERLEREMALMLKRRAISGPSPTGECMWCGEPLRHPLRWCSVDCRDDWQHFEERAHARPARR